MDTLVATFEVLRAPARSFGDGFATFAAAFGFGRASFFAAAAFGGVVFFEVMD
ncbi:hypothetical protein SB768_24950 [Burkholderia sp. SIMBA_043]|uniref:hypothetical protein n=1 Tax=Burkholderia TaxID=32008 RepID=UPI0012DA5B7B|nr:hypothetical protein [Burkholderia vietnamiensis]UBI29193.1 hypothetical protein LA325_31410 [Burkholderia vietnamiensis]